MNNLIPVSVNENQEQTVSGRMLHEFLEIGTQYTKWFERMCEYGFVENTDFAAISQKRLTAQGNETTFTDHVLTINMAKELAMLARNEKGKQARQYFIQVEKDWNTPEKVMARALIIANSKLVLLEPKARYYDLIMNNTDLLPVSVIAKDYGMTAQEMNSILHSLGVQFRRGKRWYLYDQHAEQGYTQSRTFKNEDMDKPNTMTYWTQKGRKFIYDKLKERNIWPLIEYAAS